MSIVISPSVLDDPDRFAGRGLVDDGIVVRSATGARVGEAPRLPCREEGPARRRDRASRGVARALRRMPWGKPADCALKASAPTVSASSQPDPERVTRSLFETETGKGR